MREGKRVCERERVGEREARVCVKKKYLTGFSTQTQFDLFAQETSLQGRDGARSSSGVDDDVADVAMATPSTKKKVLSHYILKRPTSRLRARARRATVPPTTT